MEDAPIAIQLRVSVRWWVRYYTTCLAIFAALHGLELNREKVSRFIARHGIKVTVVS